MAFENIILEKRGRLAFIVLNRPNKLNALSVKVQEEVVQALKDIESDLEIRVAIVRGAGRAFSVGYDIEPGTISYSHKRTILEDRNRMIEISNRWLTLWDCQKPVIAQVHGLCLAGGTDLALLADIVIASEDAQIGHPGVRGIGTPLCQMWAILVGPMRAKMLVLTGDTISGTQASEWGLVAKAVPSDQLEREVLRLAKRIAAIPTDELTMNKLVVNRVFENMGLKQSIRDACELDSISHYMPTVTEFRRILRDEGLKAALKWRDRDFKNLE